MERGLDTSQARRRDPSVPCRRLAGLPAISAVLVALCAWPAITPADEGHARQLFRRAETSYRLGDYEDAVRDYEAAYAAMPAPELLFNIAQAHRMQYSIDKKSWRLHKALALYKSYLRESQRAPNRQMVEKIIDELKQVVADVERRSREQDEPAQLVLRGTTGAQVWLDGQRLGVLPLRRAIDPGAHVVRVEKKGYVPWETTARVSAGAQVEVPVFLKRLAGAPSPTRVAPAPPVYRRWWFWAAAAVVVAGAAGAGVYWATRDGEPSGPTTIDLRN